MEKELKEIQTNKTPLIYSRFDYTKRVKMRKELEVMFNKLGIDSEMDMQDFILAEMVDNFLVTIFNTKNAVSGLKNNK